MANMDFQVVFNNANQLPEDRYVNTLYYDTGVTGFSGVGVTGVMDGIAAAYTTHLASIMGGQIASMTINAYSPGLNPGGPAERKSYAFDPSSFAGPAEMAVCLSYFGGSHSPRKRGRVYIGPLAASVINDERPTGSLQTRIMQWARAIADIGNNSAADWKQHSRTDNSYNAVTDWYVDNAWDVQRRRGAVPTARVGASM